MVFFGSKYSYLDSYVDDEKIEIGKGSFGTVFKIQKKSNHNIYAMKNIISKNFDDFWEKMIEVLGQGMANHKFILKIYEVYAWKSQDEVFIMRIIMEHCGSSLKKEIKKGFSSDEIDRTVLQLLSGFSYLKNDIDMIHRDIKPDNILIDENFDVKISDFGTCRFTKHDEAVIFKIYHIFFFSNQ